MSNYDLRTSVTAYRIIKEFTTRNLIRPQEKIGWGLQMNSRRQWTCGWGHPVINPLTGAPFTGMKDKTKLLRMVPTAVSPKMHEVKEWLTADVLEAERLVKLHIKIPLKQHEFDALVIFTLDMGHHRWLYGAINAQNRVEEQWLLAGIRLSDNAPREGSVMRRRAEYTLFTEGSVKLNDILK